MGLELEMLSLKALLLGCLHDLHICYFFDPLLPQGMDVETLCRTSATVPAVDARGAQVERAPYTTGIVYATLSHCIRSAQAMLALRTARSELDQVSLASRAVHAHPALNFLDEIHLRSTRYCPIGMDLSSS